MKKFTFLLVATCFAFSTFAQTIVTPSSPKSEASLTLTKKGSPAQNSKENSIYYTSQFNGGCASIDDPSIYSYTDDQQNNYGPVTGTNAYGDQGFAQQFHFSSNVSVVGVAVYLMKANEGSDETLKAIAMNSTYIELASVNYQAASITTTGSLNQYLFTSPISVQDVLVGVTMPDFIINNDATIVAMTSTETNCSSGLNQFFKGYIDETTVAWQPMTLDGFNVDFFVFPITSGTVNIADLDQLTSVYPNPTTDEVSVISSVKINSVEIFNVMGQMVYSSNVNDYTSKINVSDFASGSYIVKMNTESGSINKKLMVK